MGARLNQLILTLSGVMVMATNTAQAAQDQREIQQLLQEAMNSTSQPEAVQSLEHDSNADQMLQKFGVNPESFSWRKRDTPPLSQSTSEKKQELLDSAEMNLSENYERKTLAEQLSEIPSPLDTFSSGLEDGANILTGGKQAEAGEKAKKEAEAQLDSQYWTSQGNETDHFDGTYALKKNNRYQSGKATYETNENGAIRSWSADLFGVTESAQRHYSHQQNLQGKYDGDHAGHLLSSQEGGSGKVDNLVPMNGKLNTRDYRAFERENHQLLKEGYRVQLEGSNYLASSENRPEAFMVTRSVYDKDGNFLGKDHLSWTNEDMSQFQDNDFDYDNISNPMNQQLADHGITREEIEQMEQEAAGKSPSKSHVNNTREEVPEKHQGTDQNQDISQATDAAEENNQENAKGTANAEEVDRGKHQGTNQTQDVSQTTDAAEENNQENAKGTANAEEVDRGKHQGTDQTQDVSQTTDAAEENNQDNTKGTANTEEVDHGKGAKESPWLKDKDNDAQEGNARDTNQGNQRDDNLGQDNPKGSPWLKDQSKGKSEEGPNAGDESRDQNKDDTQNENPQKDGEKVKDGESSNDGWKNDGPEEDIRR